MKEGRVGEVQGDARNEGEHRTDERDARTPQNRAPVPSIHLVSQLALFDIVGRAERCGSPRRQAAIRANRIRVNHREALVWRSPPQSRRWLDVGASFTRTQHIPPRSANGRGGLGWRAGVHLLIHAPLQPHLAELITFMVECWARPV